MGQAIIYSHKIVFTPKKEKKWISFALWSASNTKERHSYFHTKQMQAFAAPANFSKMKSRRIHLFPFISCLSTDAKPHLRQLTTKQNHIIM